MMDAAFKERLKEFSYLWNREREDYALLRIAGFGETDFLIVRRSTRSALFIEDDTLAEAVVQKMLKHGAPVCDDF